MSESGDPEEVRALADRCLVRLSEIVGRYGGSVLNVMGDGLLAVFGAPVAHEDDPERAVRATLEMQRCSAEPGADFGGLPVHIGVNTGDVLFADLGPAERRDPTVMGDTTNTASRLQGAAPPGAVFVGDETYRLTRGVIRYEALDPIVLKGKAKPVRAWRAIEALEPTERTLSEGPLIGRTRELQLLMQVWDRTVAERRPHVAMLVGPPGIGKTRLEREFAWAVENRGHRVVRGRSLPYGESTGFGAFARQVRAIARAYDTDPKPVAREKLWQMAHALVEESDVDEVSSRLAILIGLDDEAVPDKGPLYAAARRFVEGLAAQGPVVLLYEDLHWGDASLLELLEFLAQRVKEVPVLFLVLARPELLDNAPTWGARLPAYVSMSLDPLSEQESVQLARELLADRARATDFASSIAARTDGNPLFIEELAASVVERQSDDTADLPTTVKAIIAARLDALPAEARRTLLGASVVGKVFWRGALARLRSSDVDQALDILEARDLVRREPTSRIEGDQQFAFKHMLIRDVAYATLSKAARRSSHSDVARFLEEALGDRVMESASLLAYHLREAGDVQAAFVYLVEAAESAGRAWAKGEAVALYGEALELIEADDPRRSHVAVRRAQAMVAAGDFAGAANDLDAMLHELRERDELEAVIARARAAYWLMDGAGGRLFGRKAVELADALRATDLRPPALAMFAVAVGLDGSLRESLAIAEEAAEQWEPGFMVDDFSSNLEQTGLMLYWLGSYERALDYSRRAYDVGSESRSLERALQAGATVGLNLAALGRFEESIEQFDRVVAQGEGLEVFPRWTARALNMSAEAFRGVFDWPEARLRNEHGIELGERAEFPFAPLQGKIDLLVTDLADGDVAAAETAWPGLHDAAEEAAGWHGWLTMTRLLVAKAEIFLARSDFEEAATWALKAIDYSRTYQRPKYELGGRLVLGSALLDMGRLDEAIVELREVASEAAQLGFGSARWRVAAELARALASTGDEDGAAAVRLSAKQLATSVASGLSDARRAQFLSAPMVAEVTTFEG